MTYSKHCFSGSLRINGRFQPMLKHGLWSFSNFTLVTYNDIKNVLTMPNFSTDLGRAAGGASVNGVQQVLQAGAGMT